MKKLMILSVLALAFAVSPVLAGDHGGKGLMFEKADTNKDGAVSKDEFMKAQEGHFAKMDANGDGSFTKDEAEAMKQKWEKKRKEYQEKKAQKLPDEHTTPIAPTVE